MRIITRPDFDGVVCAALLYNALDIEGPVKWAEPSDLQRGLVEIREGDVIANLPYDDRCALWFDHHYTNRIDRPFNGEFRIAPSAAGIIFAHYKDRFVRDYSELVTATDKIDSADLTLDEVLNPEKYGYVLLSMTMSDGRRVARFRMLDTPPRSVTALWNPLPGVTRSRRKRKLSRRFDLPDAFGPTRKARVCNGTSTCPKLRQFSREIRENLIFWLHDCLPRPMRVDSAVSMKMC